MTPNQNLISYYQLEALQKRLEAMQAELSELTKHVVPLLDNLQSGSSPKPRGILDAIGLKKPASVTPDGGMDGPLKLRCDEPPAGMAVTVGSQLRVRGWALAASRLSGLDLQVDENTPVPLAHGDPRPDVEALYPGFPEAGKCGFQVELDTAGMTPGPHRLLLTARSTDGGTLQLERVILVNSSMDEKIRVFCDEPSGLAELQPGSRLHVRGWAAAQSLIARVECHIDNGPVRVLPYGLPRPDVRDAYPEFPAAGESGFELEFTPEDLSPGEHRLSFTAWSYSGECRILEKPILVREPLHDEIAFFCDFPIERGCISVRDIVVVRGWAVAWSGIREVTFQVGDFPAVPITYGLPRPDVAVHNPDFHLPDRSGYRHFWDTAAIPNGRYPVRLTAIANSGATQVITREVVVDQNCLADYSRWIAENEPTPREKEKMAAVANTFERQPKISIVVPVYKTPLHFLEKCIDSVRAQIYTNWELCLADDGSNDPAITELLESYSELDPRIRFKTLERNRGISGATNEALSIATGDYVGFLDHDDELADFALWEMVRAINEEPLTDLFYSDEDKMDEGGRRYNWFFKPQWSPELFLSVNYLCHFIVVRRWLLDVVGELDETYREGSQDYEFLLRAIEHTHNIKRIPKILYHWRAIEGSTATTEMNKPGATADGQRALTAYLSRNHPGAVAEETTIPSHYRVRYPIAGDPNIDIIIPTGGNMSLLRRCVEDVLEKTTYRNFQIKLVDNSKQDHVQQYANSMALHGSPVGYIDWRHKRFNYSVINNEAVKRSHSPYVLFLNDDMSIVTAEWLTAMLEHAQQPAIGAVGAQLWYPNNNIQHAGVVMGVYGNSTHAFKSLPATVPHYFHFPVMTRDCSCVTAACLLISRDKFWEVDGFDEVNLSVAFQDVDLCLKLLEKGYRNVYTPYACLYHYESATKTEITPNLVEDEFIKKKWKRYIDDDPYYNPNLTRHDDHYRLRQPG